MSFLGGPFYPLAPPRLRVSQGYLRLDPHTYLEACKYDFLLCNNSYKPIIDINRHNSNININSNNSSNHINRTSESIETFKLTLILHLQYCRS